MQEWHESRSSGKKASFKKRITHLRSSFRFARRIDAFIIILGSNKWARNFHKFVSQSYAGRNIWSLALKREILYLVGFAEVVESTRHSLWS